MKKANLLEARELIRKSLGMAPLPKEELKFAEQTENKELRKRETASAESEIFGNKGIMKSVKNNEESNENIEKKKNEELQSAAEIAASLARISSKKKENENFMTYGIMGIFFVAFIIGYYLIFHGTEPFLNKQNNNSTNS